MARKRIPANPPHVSLRRRHDGFVRPRFNPGRALRGKGFAGEDLKRTDESWFTEGEAGAWAEAGAWELPGVLGKGRRAPQARRGTTVRDLLEDWMRSADFKRPRFVDGADEGGYADATRESHKFRARSIMYRPQTRAQRDAGERPEPEPFAQTSASAIRPGTVKDFFIYLETARGRTKAKGCVMTLSAAFKWGRLAPSWRDRIEQNPCLQLDLPGRKPKVRIYEFEEFLALRAMARARGEFVVAVGAALALFTGQRPTDVIAYDTAGIDEAEGLIRLVQSKSGKRIELPIIPALAGDLAWLAEERIKQRWTASALLVNAATRQGFTLNNFQKHLRELVRATAKGDAELGLAPCPSITGKSLKHFRKTLVTWLDRAKQKDKIRSVTGWSEATTPRMLAHYLAENPDDARVAMAGLVAWMQKKGMAV